MLHPSEQMIEKNFSRMFYVYRKYCSLPLNIAFDLNQVTAYKMVLRKRDMWYELAFLNQISTDVRTVLMTLLNKKKQLSILINRC